MGSPIMNSFAVPENRFCIEKNEKNFELKKMTPKAKLHTSNATDYRLFEDRDDGTG